MTELEESVSGSALFEVRKGGQSHFFARRGMLFHGSYHRDQGFNLIGSISQFRLGPKLLKD